MSSFWNSPAWTMGIRGASSTPHTIQLKKNYRPLTLALETTTQPSTSENTIQPGSTPITIKNRWRASRLRQTLLSPWTRRIQPWQLKIRTQNNYQRKTENKFSW